MIKIVDKSKCCGCSACAEVCPQNCLEMVSDFEGFNYPVLKEDLCVSCKKCTNVCPVINCASDVNQEQRAYLVRNDDLEIRAQSTSGGAFTALAKYVLLQDGVVFGAAFDEEFNVKHCYVENEKDLILFRNSKYVQSDLGNSYTNVKKFLEQDRWVCFSGTPCQVEGLYHFLGRHYDKLLLVDLVCRAVPSPLVWAMYKEYCKPSSEVTLTNALFRSKEKFGYQYSQMYLEYSDGSKQYSGVESDAYLRGFFSNLIDRPSCYKCSFKKRYRMSDLTIWDCFDVYRLDKQFDDNQGITRVLSHTKFGDEVMLAIDNCTVVEIDSEDAIRGVKELIIPVAFNQKRDSFFYDIANMNDCQVFDKWFPDTLKTKTERLARHTCEKLGIYRPAKRIARIVLGKE